MNTDDFFIADHIIDIEERAWFVAKKVHSEQKYGNEPYIEHIKRVFYRVSDACENFELDVVAKVTAILHDTVEDSDITSYGEIENLFGERVRNGVWYMTRQEYEPYFEYIARVREYPVAKLVKTCDLLDNLQYSYLKKDFFAGKIKRYEKAIALLAVTP